MNAGHILLVEDEPAIVASLRPALKASGYAVTVASDGNEALAGAAISDVDVVLLDLGLPDIDGKEVIRAIRQRHFMPIIVVSARHQEAEKVAALDEGADDYVDKPFVLRELLARIRAAIRRRQGQAQLTPGAPQKFSAPPLEIDFDTREVRLSGALVKFSPKEFNLLRELAENAGKVVTQRRLLAAGWGKSDADAQYLRVYMAMLRQKLEANPSEPVLILTEPGVGYRLAQRDAKPETA